MNAYTMIRSVLPEHSDARVCVCMSVYAHFYERMCLYTYPRVCPLVTVRIQERVSVCPRSCVYNCMMYVHAYTIICTSVRACVRVRVVNAWVYVYERACVCATELCVFESAVSPSRSCTCDIKLSCGRICVIRTTRVYNYESSFYIIKFVIKHFNLNIR